MENYTPEQCDSLYDDQAFNESDSLECVLEELASTLYFDQRELEQEFDRYLKNMELANERLKPNDDLLNEWTEEIVQLIVKHETFGPTFQQRDQVAEYLVSTFRDLGLYQSGVARLVSKINTKLASEGRNYRVDLEFSYGKNPAARNGAHAVDWGDRHRRVTLNLIEKDDVDLPLHKRKAKAIDRIEIPSVESHEFSKDYDNYWRMQSTIQENANLSSATEYLQGALEYFGRDGVKELVKQLNEDFNNSGQDFRIEISAERKLTLLNGPGLGTSGKGVFNMQLNLIKNGSKKPIDSITLAQKFVWGGPILPSPPDPPNKITNDLVPDKSTRKVNIPDHKLSR